MQLKAFKLTGIAGLILYANATWSAVLPGAAMPEQVSRALAAEEPTTAQPALPSVKAPKQETSALGPEAKKIKFQLNGIILEGNHVYSDAQLLPLYKDKLHKTISVAELFEIVQSITNFYRNNGYIISRAILPPQHVKNGVVRVKIIEGYIGQVNVGGDPGGSASLVRAYGNKIKAYPPLQINRMEKYLLLANEIPATQVKAVLAPSKTQTGAADLTLVADNQPIVGYVSYDDYGTRYIGPQQMTANLGVSSLLTAGDLTQATLTKTPKGSELTYIDVNHSLALTAEGTRLLFGGTRAQTHPLFVLQSSEIDGLNTNYYTTATFPMIRTRSQSLTARLGFNYLDSNVTFGPTSAELYTDHIRSADLGATWNFADRFYGSNLISGDFRQGLPILGYTSDNNPNTALTSRPGGNAFYSKFAIQLSRLQALKGPFSLYGIFSGQWAFNALLASEQFTFGGSQLGRGYDVAELIGDRGAAGSLELRYDLGVGQLFLQSLQFYTFYDAGEIWNIITSSSTPTKLSGTSTGIGVRFFATKYVSGNLMWTQTLTKQVAAEELIGDGRRPRTFFSVVASLD